jgi:uncharacterized membrane protein (DUF106 family)
MAFFDNLLSPLLEMNAAFIIISISILLSVLITLIYKWMTDQTLMKSLKDDIKKFQDQMKKERDNPKKMLEIQKKAMDKNMQYMMHSMKPTLVTFIPLILIFGWLNAHFTYEPIYPASEFGLTATFAEGSFGNATVLPVEGINVVGDSTVDIKDGKANWRLKGTAGEYLVQVEYNGKKFDKEVLISNNHIYATPVKTFKEEKITAIGIDVQKLRVFGRDFNVFGYHPGWLGIYIITSIIFSMGLRKLMNLY